MCRDGIPPKNCAAVIILARSSSGAKRKYFLTSAQGLLRNVALQFHSRGWITFPGFPSKKKVEFDRLVLSPPPSPSIGVGMSEGVTTHTRSHTHTRNAFLRQPSELSQSTLKTVDTGIYCCFPTRFFVYFVHHQHKSVGTGFPRELAITLRDSE